MMAYQIYSNSNNDALLKRGYMALEDGEWDKADAFFESVLNTNAECAEAYLGKLMAELKVPEKERLISSPNSFENSNNYKKAIRFGDDELKEKLLSDISHIQKRNEEARKQDIYYKAVSTMRSATTAGDFQYASKLFEQITGFKDADAKKGEAIKKSEEKKAEFELIRKSIGNCPEKWISAHGRFPTCVDKYGKVRSNQELFWWAQTGKKWTLAADVPIYERKQLCDFSFVQISTDYDQIVGLRCDGTVLEADNCDSPLPSYHSSYDWTDIVAISAGKHHRVGLRSDGTVVAKGKNDDGQCNVSGWTNIVSVSASANYTLALTASGRVIATGKNKDFKSNHLGWEVNKWTDIVAISAGEHHILGLRQDGTVIATGNNEQGQCNVSNWTNIIAISAGNNYSLGLHSDGTVIAIGNNVYGQCCVSSVSWTDIVAISAGYSYSLGLRSDGVVIAAGEVLDLGSNSYRWCNAYGLNPFRCLEDIEYRQRQEAEARRKAERDLKIQPFKDEEASLRDELFHLKGVFSSMRRKKIEERLVSIEKEISKIKKEYR